MEIDKRMIEKTDIFIGAGLGYVFAILVSTMIFIQIRNAKKDVVDKRIYMMSWVGSLPVITFGIFLNIQIKSLNIHIPVYYSEAIICILLTLALCILFYKYDRDYLGKLYVNDKIYHGAPKSHIFITAFVCSVSVSILIGCLILAINLSRQ